VLAFGIDERENRRDGDAWALANRGSSYMESGNPREAIADWNLAAAAGDDYSQYHLGVAYMTGIPGILGADMTVGVEWLRKSAAQGNADAKRSLPLPPPRSARTDFSCRRAARQRLR
jgi:TPR repeat protein